MHAKHQKNCLKKNEHLQRARGLEIFQKDPTRELRAQSAAENVGCLKPTHPSAESRSIGLNDLLEERKAEPHNQGGRSNQKQRDEKIQVEELHGKILNFRRELIEAEHVIDDCEKSRTEWKCIIHVEVGPDAIELKGITPQHIGKNRNGKRRISGNRFLQHKKDTRRLTDFLVHGNRTHLSGFSPIHRI